MKLFASMFLALFFSFNAFAELTICQIEYFRDGKPTIFIGTNFGLKKSMTECLSIAKQNFLEAANADGITPNEGVITFSDDEVTLETKITQTTKK